MPVSDESQGDKCRHQYCCELPLSEPCHFTHRSIDTYTDITQAGCTVVSIPVTDSDRKEKIDSKYEKMYGCGCRTSITRSSQWYERYSSYTSSDDHLALRQTESCEHECDACRLSQQLHEEEAKSEVYKAKIVAYEEECRRQEYPLKVEEKQDLIAELTRVDATLHRYDKMMRTISSVDHSERVPIRAAVDTYRKEVYHSESDRRLVKHLCESEFSTVLRIEKKRGRWTVSKPVLAVLDFKLFQNHSETERRKVKIENEIQAVERWLHDNSDLAP